ncbi:MAG: alpha/beta hydrolase family protein [Oceanidesulfovibrio sp.]
MKQIHSSPSQVARLGVLLLALLTAFVLDSYAAGNENEFDAHATAFRYYFEDRDMDFHFGNLVLGATVHGGAAVGEAFYAASHIEDGDSASWQKEWSELARRVEARGEHAMEAGHRVSARDHLFRAAYYYRSSLVSMLPDDPALARNGRKARALFRQAGALLDPPLEYLEIPFEDTSLPGYFWPAPDKGSRKTLLMIGGGETFAEDLFFYIAPQAHARGYNFATVDLPGQGLTPFQELFFRTDTYIYMRAVVDALLGRPDVAPKGLAAYGISGGGLFVPQAAMYDPRIRAVVMNSAVTDAHALFATMPAALAMPEDKAGWTSFHRDVVTSICWRYGVPLDEPDKLIGANAGNTFDPAKVAVPALILVGEGEYASEEVQRQQQYAMENFPNPGKRLIVTPTDEGAANHCIMENRSLMGALVFDWLDEVLP